MKPTAKILKYYIIQANDLLSNKRFDIKRILSYAFDLMKEDYDTFTAEDIYLSMNRYYDYYCKMLINLK